MKPWLAFAVISAGASFVAFADASAQSIAGLHGPAAAAIEAEIRTRDISEVFEASVFYGDFDRDGRDDAVSFVYYPSGGNSFMLATWIWRQGDDGYMLLRAPSTEEIFGIEPRDVSFGQGFVEVTTTVPAANDPRCCPTGQRTFNLSVGGDGASRIPTPIGGPSDGSWTAATAPDRAGVQITAISLDGRTELAGHCEAGAPAAGLRMTLRHAGDEMQAGTEERIFDLHVLRSHDHRTFAVKARHDPSSDSWTFEEPMSAAFLDAFAAGSTMEIHENYQAPLAEFGLRGTADAVRSVREICGATLVAASAQSGPLPFRDGRYLSDTAMCALSVEQIVARVGDEIHYMLYEIAAPQFNGVESLCTVTSASRTGDTVDIRATCELEGMVQETLWSVDFVSPTAFRSGGTTYRLCE